jgi:type IV pilus assembly protein PilA
MKEQGFSLVELLVVMLVIGILSAIAVPIFLHQRQKAHDASTISDVTRLGKELATVYVDGHALPSLDFTSDPEFVFVVDGASRSALRLSNGTARPTSGYAADLDDSDGWCVSLIDPGGLVKQYRYTAHDGLAPGGC